MIDNNDIVAVDMENTCRGKVFVLPETRSASLVIHLLNGAKTRQRQVIIKQIATFLRETNILPGKALQDVLATNSSFLKAYTEIKSNGDLTFKTLVADDPSVKRTPIIVLSITDITENDFCFGFQFIVREADRERVLASVSGLRWLDNAATKS
jgi:hypothetical protein